MPRLNHGILVAVEGIDGAGKTTQVQRLASIYQGDGFQVLQEKEPTNGKWGKMLRASATTGRLSATKEFRAFVEDRREHVREVITPALNEGAIVLVDRYFLSSVAYQGARGLNQARILKTNEHFAPLPDVAIILEVPPEVGVKRIATRGDELNQFESLENLAAVAACFASIDRPYISRIDGTANIEDVTRTIQRIVAEGPMFKRLCAFDYRPRCEPVYCSSRIAGNCPYVGLRSLGLQDSSSVTAEINAISYDSKLSIEERYRQVSDRFVKH